MFQPHHHIATIAEACSISYKIGQLPKLNKSVKHLILFFLGLIITSSPHTYDFNCSVKDSLFLLLIHVNYYPGCAIILLLLLFITTKVSTSLLLLTLK